MSQVVAVTGASAGIDRAMVRAFAERGAPVALLARGETGLAAAAAEVEKCAGTAVVFALDAADPDALRAAVEPIETELGQLSLSPHHESEATLAAASLPGPGVLSTRLVRR